MTTLDKRRAARKAAMPDVKKLVKKHGRAAISGCMLLLAAQAKAAKKIVALRREADELARRL